MSATALRWCAVPLGLLAFATRLAIALWWQPVTWRFSLALGLLFMLGATLVAVGIPFGIFALISRRYRRPAEFALGEGGFTVAPSAVFGATQTILWMFLGAGLVPTERVPNSDSVRLAEFGPGWFVSLALLGGFMAGALAFLVVRRPRLLLDTEGLTIRRLWRSTRLAWEDLAPGGPLPPAKKTQRHLQLYRKPPPNYPNYVPAEAIPIGWLDIDPAYLAAAIRHYAEDPQDRAAIGTVAELDRLRAPQCSGVHEDVDSLK